MKFKVIGSGSKMGNCYEIKGNNGSLLLDCGCNYKDIIKGLEYYVYDIAGVLITHRHSDHTKSIKHFIDYGIPVFGNYDVADQWRGVTKLDALHTKQIGDFNVVPFFVPHDGIPNYGYLISHHAIGKLLYITDFQYCRYIFSGQKIDHMVIECDYVTELLDYTRSNFEHTVQGHMSLETIKRFIKINATENLKTVTLVHLSQITADPQLILDEVKKIVPENVKVRIAEAGLEFEL